MSHAARVCGVGQGNHRYHRRPDVRGRSGVREQRGGRARRPGRAPPRRAVGRPTTLRSGAARRPALSGRGAARPLRPLGPAQPAPRAPTLRSCPRARSQGGSQCPGTPRLPRGSATSPPSAGPCGPARGVTRKVWITSAGRPRVRAAYAWRSAAPAAPLRPRSSRPVPAEPWQPLNRAATYVAVGPAVT